MGGYLLVAFFNFYTFTKQDYCNFEESGMNLGTSLNDDSKQEVTGSRRKHLKEEL